VQRLLFFPGHRMLAYEWSAGAYRRVRAFEPNDDGLAAFRAWLAEAPRTPIHLLIDVIEEEFHLDRVPHVIGRERRQLYGRTLRRYFRSTELRAIQRQGRDTTGRRDERVLVAGLTNPQLLAPWLDPIDAVGVPLKGIYSLPLVGAYLLPHLGAARAPDVLVVSQQVAATLRQSFYQNGQLRFSRLVPGHEPASSGAHPSFIQHELARTLQFLETQRLRQGSDPVQVFVLAPEAQQARLTAQLRPVDGATIQVVALERLASAVGLKGPLPGPHADTVFGHVLLSRRWRRNHYGGARMRRNYLVQRTRNGLWALAATLVIIACALSGGAWLQGRAYQAGTREAEARAADFERLYRERLSGLDRFDHRGADVKEAVDRVSRLAVALPDDPEPVMARVGAVLSEHPRVEARVLRFQTAGGDASETAAGKSARVPATARLARRALDRGGLGYTAVLQGRVVDFGGDYRRAQERFQALLADLRSANALDDVRVRRAPFALDPDARVSGEAAASDDPKQAAFTIAFRHRGTDAPE
jgi:hypothetical protein